jgi:hypothetical protein
MAWQGRTAPRTTSPAVPARARDLADAVDLAVSRSFQQEEVPVASGRVLGSDLLIGPRLRPLVVYLVVFRHGSVERRLPGFARIVVLDRYQN